MNPWTKSVVGIKRNVWVRKNAKVIDVVKETSRDEIEVGGVRFQRADDRWTERLLLTM